MRLARALVVAKIVLIGWPLAWTLLVAAPQWLGTFSQLAPLLVCALAAGVALTQRWNNMHVKPPLVIPHPDETFLNLDMVAALLSGISAAVLGVYLIASIALRCGSVMSTAGDPVFAAACLDERSLAWALAATALAVALLDTIYLVMLYYYKARARVGQSY